MSILGDIIEKLFGEVFFDEMEELAEAFAELGRLADIDYEYIFPCGFPPLNTPVQRIKERLLPSCSGEFPQDIGLRCIG